MYTVSTPIAAVISEGDVAPDFELRGAHDGELDSFRLSTYTDRSENVLIAFYAFDFNPTCTAGMCSLRDTNWFSLTPNMNILGVSTDSVYAHRAFAEEHNIGFPLLSDTDGSVVREYGVLADELDGMPGVARRSAFLVDADRRVQFAASVSADSPEDMDITPVRDAVDALAN